MKILIITYSREVNPGTFLQAYGVQYAMKQLFPDAQIDLLKHKRLYNITGNSGPAKKRKNWTWLKSKIFAIPRRFKYERLYSSSFSFTAQEFDLFDYDEKRFKETAEQYDLIVVGSDTILINLKKKNKYGLMWLLGIDASKILFAASAAPVKYEVANDEIETLRRNFLTFKFLGVRDAQTHELLSKKIGLGERVELMFDPSYLIPMDLFNLNFINKVRLNRIHSTRKIALVNFGEDFKQKRYITENLKKKGFYVISTLYNPWADRNLMTLSPFEWAGMFKHIDMTVTERFHDSVFTLRNNKPVIAIDWKQNRIGKNGKSKTQDLLERYGLGEFHLVSTDETVSKFDETVDLRINTFDKEKIANKNDQIRNDYGHFLSKFNS